MMKMKNAFILSVALLHFQLAVTSYFIEIRETLFHRVIGYSLVGNPIIRFTSRRSLHCNNACTNTRSCRYLKITSNHRNQSFLCEVFDCSITPVFKSLGYTNEVMLYRAEHLKMPECAPIQGYCGTSYRYPMALSAGSTMAFCDMTTTDGGWTMLQRRVDGILPFDRDWQSYKNGFGDLNGEFWLGLEAAHWLTKGGDATLRFDLWDGSTHYYMEYYNAVIESEAENYRLDYDGMSGDAGDSMTKKSKGKFFSTKDRDNDEKADGNCAALWPAGWWYTNCQDANLNGVWGSTSRGKGINWNSITGKYRSLSKTEMKMKPSK